MFNDECGLTQAVLEGRKTMTRRIIKYPSTFKGQWVAGFNIHRSHSDKKTIGYPCMYDADEREFDGGEILPRYKVGEVVAVAQSYGEVAAEMMLGGYDYDLYEKFRQNAMGMELAGNRNKMFVRADLMPHHIRITDIKIERLQNISDEDCMREGVEFSQEQYKYDGAKSYFVQNITEIGSRWNRMFCKHFGTPREAFAALIDKVSGKGTWESNPYVFVYEFELID